jgi:hypothetical protein
MNHPVIPIATQGASRQRKREAPKGRRVDPQALREVQDLLGDSPRRRDLLIEYLHKIQDRWGALSAAHLAALAQELKLAQSEVYEVATFYHHFDVLRDGEAAPAPDRARVRRPVVRMAGARGCWTGCRRSSARTGARAGRAVHRPLRAGAGGAGRPASGAARDDGRVRPRWPGKRRDVHTSHDGYDAYRAAGGYALLRDCVEGRRDVESVIATLEAPACAAWAAPASRPGRKWRIVRAEPARASWPSTSTKANPAPSRTASISNATRTASWKAHADRRLGGRHRDHLYLPARRIPRPAAMLEPSWTAARRSAGPGHAADRTAPRRRRLHLRRRVGDDRIDRRQARHAAPASALRGAGRPVRPAYAGTQLRNPALGARHRRAGPGHGSPATAAMAARACVRSRSRAACATRASSWRRPASRCRS